MEGRSIWDYLAWLALAFLLVWLALEIFVFVEMPLWLKHSPWAAVIYLAGWGVHSLESIVTNIYNIKRSEVDIAGDINDIKEDMREEKENKNLPLLSKKK